MRDKLDKKQYEASISRLSEIFSDISNTVNQVSTWRCPYKNVDDLCTANFKCRNQLKNTPDSHLPVCTGSDNLDYRHAWYDSQKL